MSSRRRTHSWPVRHDGWEQALAARVRQMLAEIAARHALEAEWADSVMLEVGCTWPRQAGLDFDLWFAFGDDEITFGGGEWYADVFPMDDPDKFERVRAAVDGLFTGEARVLLYRALGRRKPYWSVLQLRVDGRWENISSGAGCAIPPIVRPSIVRNGHPDELRGFRPAWGSLALLLGLAALVLHFVL